MGIKDGELTGISRENTALIVVRPPEGVPLHSFYNCCKAALEALQKDDPLLPPLIFVESQIEITSLSDVDLRHMGLQRIVSEAT